MCTFIKICTKIKPKIYTANPSYHICHIQHILAKLKESFDGFQTIPYSKRGQCISVENSKKF